MNERGPTDPRAADGSDVAPRGSSSPESSETASAGGAKGVVAGERDVIAELAMLPAAQRAMLVGSLSTAERHELHDRWERGAFADARVVPLLWQHRGAAVGVLSVVAEDARGLRVEGARIRKFKTSDGAFVWAPSLAAGQPATLLGYPVVERPVRVRALLAAAEEGLEALPPDLGEGWRVVRLALVRSRVLHVGDRWRGASEFLVRMYRES
ncbi:hypothetical protein ASF00_17320 [Sphingomonas sp. Leaf34]|nr:hypothetical protein ASF00_17320 [Sphingomonas sp. Leaf34]